jgi:hypothetical protein
VFVILADLLSLNLMFPAFGYQSGFGPLAVACAAAYRGAGRARLPAGESLAPAAARRGGLSVAPAEAKIKGFTERPGLMPAF